MDSSPDVDDLRLVMAVASTGSLGGAARRLQVSQPSASQRLARLERRAGVTLFVRDTQGARPTAAGEELVRQAEHVLGHLEGAFDAAREASESQRLSVATIPSLAATALPALVDHLGVNVDQRVDHGERLVEWVHEATLDAAVIGMAHQLVLPRGLLVHPVGRDVLVLMLPAGAPAVGRGRRPLRDRRVLLATYDDSASAVRDRLAGLGAEVVRAATVPTALAMARRATLPAVVPRSTVAHLHAGDRVRPLPWQQHLRLSLVTGRDPDPRLLAVLPALRRDLHLAASD